MKLPKTDFVFEAMMRRMMKNNGDINFYQYMRPSRTGVLFTMNKALTTDLSGRWLEGEIKIVYEGYGFT